MVAAVSSSGLGLFGSSRDVLGGAGMQGDAALGRGTDRIYVNAATGNLIVQSRDEYLSSLGLGVSVVRTYNSQGLLNDDNGDNWMLGVHQRVYGLTGTVNTAGSSILKQFGDGCEVRYQYNATRALYISTDGGGAHDTLSFNASTSQWTSTDGSTRTTETYNSAGQLLASRDADGNTVTYGYTGALLTSITDASGQVTTLVYSGNNLTEIKVVSDGKTQTLTRYTYDTSNRLSTVQVDLTPENTGDARVYKTTYAYEDASRRIKSITQDDGSSVSFTYQSVNGQFRVATYTVTNAGGDRRTEFTYSDLKTEMKDALGQITTYTYDSAGQPTSVLSPTVGGTRRETRYGYDAEGNVILITEDPTGLNRQTVLTYDAQGNVIGSRDSLGNSTARTYNANNQLLTETQYVVRDPDGAGSGAPGTPLTTRYAYDGENHLRFVISPDGRALEHRYNAAGQRVLSLRYTGAFYTAAPFAESDLTTWAAAQDPARLERVAYAYDFRGNLSSTTSGASITRFVYDQRGQLLQTIDARGEATTDPNDYRTVFTYDGLGRMLSQTEWVSATSTRSTLMSYDDVNRKIITTLANGLITTSVYSQAGELLSVSNGTNGSLGTTTYKYDLGGRLLMVTDPSGVRTFNLYNEAGDKVATVDGDGTLREFTYNRAAELIKTVEYATLLSSAKLATLVDASGNPVNVALASLRPVVSNQDRITRSVYDASGARAFDIDATGAVTGYRYDGASRLIESVQYAKRISINRTVDELLPSAVTVTADANDRRTRSFYNNDGVLIGTLDAAGYLSEYVYGASGHLIQEISYAKQTAAAVRAAGTLSELKSSAGTDPDHDRITRYFYDDQGRQDGILDAEGYLTATVFDAAGNVAERTRFDQVLAWSAAATVTSLRAQVAASIVRERTTYTYSGAEEVLTEVFSRGTASAAASVTTAYTYDDGGNVLSVTRAVGTPEARTTATRYDALGRIIQELTAEGRALITASMTPAQIDDIWARYGITYAYDLAGRRISATVRPNDTQTNTTLRYYNNDGQLRLEVNALGERIEHRYNALGQKTDEIRYTNRIATTGLTGGLLTDALITTLTGNTSVNDARTVYTYTLTGQVESVRVLKNATAAEDGLTTYSYNAFGENVIKTTWIDAARTLQHEYQYDNRGLLTLTSWDSSGLNTTEARTYDAFGRLLSVRDARLNVVNRYEYDRLGRQIASTDASTTDRTVTTYDAFSRVLTVLDALNNATTYHYDDAVRQMTLTTPEGIEVVTTFSVHGEQLTVTAAGNTTRYTYDANGQLKVVSDNLGTLESRNYDRRGRQISGTNARGIVTTFAYDAADRVLTRTVDSGSGGLALVTTYTYDSLGRVTRVQEPSGRVTETTYDAASRVTQVAIDPNGLNLRTTYAYNRRDDLITVTEGVGSAQPRITTYQYDALGRRIEQMIDPAGLKLRTQYKYDANGNVTRRIDANGNSTWYVYDADNQATEIIDALGGVTRQAYDLQGRLTSTRRFASSISTATFGDVVTSIAISNSANDRFTQSVYDKDGRARFSINALGGVIEHTFDANGNVTVERQYAVPVAAGTYLSTDAVSSALSAAESDRVTWMAYDLRGQMAFRVDGLGAVTQYTYDANGNVIAQTAFAALRSTTLATDLAALQSWASSNGGNAQNRTTRYWFDSLDRTRFIFDGEGYLRETRYNDEARTQIDVVYAKRPTIAANATLTQVVAAATSTADDQLTTTLFDVAGRTSRVTDALGNYDEYTYDAVGNRITFRNKKGSVWDYEYNAAGHLTREIAPAVAVTTVTENSSTGALTSSTNDSLRIATVMTYDALGNVRTRTEAAGTSQQRTTTYTYDALGRQIRTDFPSVGVYNAVDGDTKLGAGGATVIRTETSTILFSETSYDALGNAFRNRDVAGNYSYKVYDALGRVQYEVDVGRYVTAYTYDTFGNQVSLTRYANALSGTPLPTTGSSLAATEVTTRLTLSSTTDRTITKKYDRLNRVIQVTQPTVDNYLTTAGNSGGTMLRVGATVLNEYDAFGQVVRASELIAQNTYADMYFYYDRRGLKTAQLDALKYLTIFEHDQSGNLTRQVEYSRPVTGTVSTSSFGTIVTTTATANAGHTAGYDRDVRFAYDRLNRKTSEARVGVEYTTISAGNTTTAVGDQVTTYGYDVLGNQTRVTVGGANTYTYYDALGRITAVAEPTRDRGDGAMLTPLTLMRRDAHGNLVEQRVLAGGAVAGADKTNETKYTPSAESNKDRLTLMRVDSHGHTVQTYEWLDASVATSRYASYNARGEVAKEWQQVTNPTVPTGATTETLVTLYQYDTLGRQIVISETQRYDGANTVMATTRSSYNGFGELISKSIDGLAGGETFAYDQAGRLWRTNSEDGVYKVYLYDLQGNATAKLTSRYNASGSVDLRAVADAAAANALAGTIRTETVYDRMGRVLEQREPSFALPITLEQIPAVGIDTFQLLRYLHFAAPSDQTVIVRVYIDGVERSVVNVPGTADKGVLLGLDGANHTYVITFSRPGAPEPLAYASGTFVQNQPPTPSTIKRFPQSTEAHPTTLQTIDRWGNVIQTAKYIWQHLFQADGTALPVIYIPIWNYRYNQYNQLIEIKEPPVRAVQVNSGTGAITNTATPVSAISRNHYDLFGRLIGTQDGNGNLNEMRLNQAGQVTAERSADNQLKSYVYDSFGQQIQITDQSGYRTRQLFDRAGRLVATASEVNFGAFGATDVTSVPAFSPTDNGTIVKQYTYDQAGRRISETTGDVQWATTVPDARNYTYDLMGNIIGGTLVGVFSDVRFDAKGNKTFHRDSNLAQATWTYDYFGHVVGHVDFGGATYTYTYDENTWLLKTQTTVGTGLSANQNKRYEYDEVNRVTRITDTGAGVDNRITQYMYDGWGNIGYQRTTIGGLVHEDTRITYDGVGRLSQLSGLGFVVTYSYDLADNRTRIQATYAANGYALNNQDLWYRYDAMNRVTISQGANEGGFVRIGTAGTELTYDARGSRASALTGGQRSNYVYDGVGRLVQIRDVSNRLLEDRTYDRASHVTRRQWDTLEGSTWVTRRTTTEYDFLGRPLREQTNRLSAGIWIPETSTEWGTQIVTNVSIGGYDGVGNVLTYRTRYEQSNGTLWYVSTHTYTYQKGEGYEEATHVVDNSAVFQDGTTTNSYNANNELIRFSDSNAAGNNRYFANNVAGNPLTVVKGNYGTNPAGAFSQAVLAHNTANAGFFFFSPEGKQVGMFTQLDGAPKANFDVNYTPVSPLYPAAAPSSYVTQAGDTLRNVAIKLLGDGSFWYLIGSANGLSDPDAVIPEGRTLTVPNQVISLSNTANVFKPFNIADAIGDTTPTQPALPPVSSPAKKKGCGVLGMILVVVVAVVATVFTAGAAAGALGASVTTATGTATASSVGVWAAGTAVLSGSIASGSLAAGLAAAAIGGAIGSIASQGVAIATGLQQGFNWSGVALGAIGASVGAAAGGIPGLRSISAAASKANKFLGAAFDAAAGNAITQGVAVVTKLQKDFNWQSVAFAAVSAPVSSYVSPKASRLFGGTSTTLGKFASDVSGTVVSAGVRAAIGGKVNGLQVLTDAFGTAIGNALVGKLQWKEPPPAVIAEQTGEPQEAISVAEPQPSVTQRPVELPVLPSLDLPLILQDAVPIIPERMPISVDDVPPPPPPPVTRELQSTLWQLAKEDLGSNATNAQIQARVLQYMELNDISYPRKLREGALLLMPTGTEPVSAEKMLAYEKSDYELRVLFAKREAARQAAAEQSLELLSPTSLLSTSGSLDDVFSKITGFSATPPLHERLWGDVKNIFSGNVGPIDGIGYLLGEFKWDYGRVDARYNITRRAGAGLGAVGSLIEIKAGLAMSGTGIGAALGGGFLVFNGADNLAAYTQTALTGESVDPYGLQFFNIVGDKLGVDPALSRVAYTGVQLTTGIAAAPRFTVTSAQSVRVSAVETPLAGTIRNVNPTGGTMNCVNCVIASDATLAGNRASAMPGNPTSLSVLEDTYGGTFQAVSGPMQIGSILSRSGNGSRGIVFGESLNGWDPGHVFNVINKNGSIQFVDGQIGRGGLGNFDYLRNFQFLLTHPGTR
jgi:YD repeat-containing protein